MGESMIESLSNVGVWEKVGGGFDYQSPVIEFRKIPYMGKGTKWNYFLVFSTILKSANIIRATKNERIKFCGLRLKELEEGVEIRKTIRKRGRCLKNE
jgi:hypothetical protein